VPRANPGGTTVIVVFSPATCLTSTVSPVGLTNRNTSGDTGSLNVSLSAAGDWATTARSAGSLRTREACASAADD
jgi:hypothetical protein